MFERFKKQPEQLEVISEDIKYGIDFDWGQLTVTEEADRSFELVPLVPTLDKDKVEQTSTPTSDMQLLICSPDQMLDLANSDYLLDNPNNVNVFSSSSGFFAVSGRKDPNKLFISAPIEKQELIDSAGEVISSFADTTGISLDDIVNSDGIPVQEFMTQNTSQYLLHKMCDGIEDILTNAEIKKLDNKIKRRLIGRTSLWGVAGIGLSGAYFGAAEAFEGGPDGLTYALAGANALLYLSCAEIEILRYLERENIERSRNLMVSGAKAHEITHDIHNAYCTDHFDAKIQQALDEN